MANSGICFVTLTNPIYIIDKLTTLTDLSSNTSLTDINGIIKSLIQIISAALVSKFCNVCFLVVGFVIFYVSYAELPAVHFACTRYSNIPVSVPIYIPTLILLS